MVKYYTWYQEHRLDKDKRNFLFAIRTPEKGLMNPWAYLSMSIVNDILTRVWINTAFVEPKQLIACDESSSDKKYVGRYLKDNKGKFIIEYFKIFGT